MLRCSLLTLPLLCCISLAKEIPPEKYRTINQPVQAINDTTILCEAEEFKVEKPGGWQSLPFGKNYYAATFANAFLSRKAFLGAPPQCETTTAKIAVNVPKAGRYLALIRYEAVYRFETRFTLKVEQNGKVKLNRLYGARDNLKIWAFRQKLKKEVAWSWGPGENVVWEGHDAFVQLDKGKAELTLIAEKQPEAAAKRNVDLVMLTSDVDQVKMRIEKENYLPLDGMLTQSGDVYFRLRNHPGSAAMQLVVNNGTEHSPYWVHIRSWKPKTIKAQPGEKTEWVETGSLLDTLSDGQWKLTARATGPQATGLLYDLEVGVRDVTGKISTIRTFAKKTGDLTLTYDAGMRYTRQIRETTEVLYDLIDYLKKQKVHGKEPKQTLIYGYTFDPVKGNAKYNAAIDQFISLIGATALNRTRRAGIETKGDLIRGYIDVRGRNPMQLQKLCQDLKAEGKAGQVAVVSLGDEIGLPRPRANDHAGFQNWLKSLKLKPSDINSKYKTWEDVKYSPAKANAESNPALYYYSMKYRYRYGIGRVKELTDTLKKHLPNARIGANFSPHHHHMYLGPTYQWISLFREDGMTMPWGEDYVWQVPVGTQQMNFLMPAMYRCAIRGKKDRKIQYYVMPHTPGQTLNNWRRQFYGDLAQGVKIFNLFEFRPVQAAYTENHCSNPEMYQNVRVALHELGQFEDIVQDGQVRTGVAGLWFSEAADVWDDYEHPMGAGKRCLFIGARHQQIPLDCVLDGDDLSPYKVLYLTDQHVTRSGSQAIAKWVNNGGKLFATAGAGMFDEFNQPNKVLRDLMGVTETKLQRDEKETIVRAKENLPWAEALDVAKFHTNATVFETKIYGVKSHFKVTNAFEIAAFRDGSPAIATKKVGKGHVTYCGFLPGLSYFKPALPKLPVDRGVDETSLCHFIPTEFDKVAARLIATPSESVQLPVICSNALVASSVIESKHGLIIPLVNWSKGPIKGLRVEVNLPNAAKSVTLATGKKIKTEKQGKKTIFTLDLDVADTLILR